MNQSIRLFVQVVQSSNLRASLYDRLLNMLMHVLQCVFNGFSGNQLPHNADYSVANLNAVFMSTDAGTYSDVTVCCSVVKSVTELFGWCPTLLTAVKYGDGFPFKTVQ